MKICLLMGGNEEGGLESHFVDVSNALGKHHDVHVIAHPKYTTQFTGVKVHELDMTKSRRNVILLFNVVKVIRQINPDILHAQANKAVAIIASVKRFLPTDIRFIATLHNMKRNLKAYASFDCVIGVSKRIMEHLNHANKVVIYNGIVADHTRFRSRNYLLQEAQIETDKVLLISLARIVNAKRIDVLLNAFSGVKNAHLVLVGDGPKKLEMEALSKKLGISNITFLGHRQDNVELLSSADICVISSDREGFPYVLVETLLAGTAMISTDVSDVKSILPSQAVVPQDSPEKLQQAMQDAVDDTDHFYQNYKSVFEWANTHLTFDYMLQEIEKVYNEELLRK